MEITATGTEARVCKDIAARQELGLNKYGISVEGSPLSLRRWLQHSYTEKLDDAVYMKRAIEEIDEIATKIAADLFTDGQGRRCTRLVMEFGESTGGAGLCEQAVVDRITQHLK